MAVKLVDDHQFEVVVLTKGTTVFNDPRIDGGIMIMRHDHQTIVARRVDGRLLRVTDAQNVVLELRHAVKLARHTQGRCPRRPARRSLTSYPRDSSHRPSSKTCQAFPSGSNSTSVGWAPAASVMRRRVRR